MDNIPEILSHDDTEHKQAKAALLENETKFRSFVENAPDGIFLTDGDTNYRLVNSAACNMTGYTSEEFARMNIRDLVPAEGVVEAKAFHDRLVEDGRVSLEVQLRRKDGTTFWVALDAVKIDEDNLLAFCKDITKRRLAEEALQESEWFLRKAQTVGRIGCYRVDIPLGIWESSQSFDEIFDIDANYPRDISGWLDLVISSSRDEHRQYLMGMLMNKDSFDLEYRINRRSDGEERWVSGHGALEYDNHGQALYLIGTMQDITERKRTEQALGESEERYRTLVQTANEAIVIAQDGVFRYANPRMHKLVGVPSGDLEGKPVLDFVWPEDRELVMTNHKKRVANEPVSENNDFRIIGVGNEPIWVSMSTTRILWHGRPATLNEMTDITERKMAEEERRKLEGRMSQVQKLEALGTLVGGVAHNFNNVLMVIMGAASLLEEGATETKDLKACTLIGKACMRGRDMVKSLIQFAQPSLSNQVPCDLHALIKELRFLLESTTGNRIEVVEAFTAEPLWMQGDAGNLSNALMNLCLNSLDAMPNGGILTFRTTIPETDWVALFIEDNGEGIPPEILARVAEPFFTTKEVGQGTGLGLSMTHGVVKAHGGTMEISSAPGRGTTIQLRFPRIPAPTVKETIATRAPSLGPLSVLMVDDDEDVRFLVARMLKRAGLQIKTVAGGEEALESLDVGPLPDLIVLDQNMPRMNGIQTVDRVRALHPDMPILISSGQPDIEDWDCFKQPNVAVISKPFEVEELLAKLAEMALKPRIS